MEYWEIAGPLHLRDFLARILLGRAEVHQFAQEGE